MSNGGREKKRRRLEIESKGEMRLYNDRICEVSSSIAGVMRK